jgi:hypothetical protein
MTAKVESEERQEAASVEVSKKKIDLSERQRFVYSHAPAMRTTSLAAAPFSAKQLYFTVSVYGILLAGGVWATVNVLNWFWHKLL